MTAEALASVITDEIYVPTTNQIIAVREKGKLKGGGGMREDVVSTMGDVVVRDYIPDVNAN